MNRTRKTVKRTIWIVLGVCLVIWAANSCLDAPAPDDADLRIAYDVIPDEENTFTYFSRAAAELQWPEETAQKDLLADMASGKAWDDAVANEILAQNEGIFALIEQGLACPRCQLPEVTGYGDSVSYLKRWRSVARLAAIRAQWLLRNGHDEEAFEQAMLVVRFGHRVQNGRACLIAYLVGLSIEEIGLRQTRRMLTDTTLDPDRLTAYIPTLAECRASGQGLADALRSDYACACRLVNDMVAGRSSVKSHGVHKYSQLRLFFFKPNKTKRALARTTRALIANASTTHDDATPLDF